MQARWRRDARADALVLFSATGDLMHRKIYPALQSLVRRGGSRSR
jgi:glucose-6-phosphate 1-dehydrogenase